MAAADVTAVPDSVSDERERPSVLAQYPFHTEAADDRAQRLDGPLELALLDGDRDDVVAERGATAMGDERAEKRQAILAARHSDDDAVARPQHRKLAERSSDRRMHSSWDVVRVHVASGENVALRWGSRQGRARFQRSTRQR